MMLDFLSTSVHRLILKLMTLKAWWTSVQCKCPQLKSCCITNAEVVQLQHVCWQTWHLFMWTTVSHKNIPSLPGDTWLWSISWRYSAPPASLHLPSAWHSVALIHAACRSANTPHKICQNAGMHQLSMHLKVTWWACLGRTRISVCLPTLEELVLATASWADLQSIADQSTGCKLPSKSATWVLSSPRLRVCVAGTADSLLSKQYKK